MAKASRLHNGAAATSDKAGNLLSDPSNGATFAWNVRNQL